MLNSILLAFALIVLAAHLVSTAIVLLRYLRPDAGLPGNDSDLPLISLIIPVCGVDQSARETLGSAFGQDYPRYELLFCVASENDPAAGLVRELIAEHDHPDVHLLVGDDRISSNPKLNNVFKGYRASRGDWVSITDSNLLLPPSYLRQLVSQWRPGIGILSSPPEGARPGNFWGAVECAFLNSYGARWILAGDSIGLGFALGKTLFWRREVIEAGGGLRTLGREMAEDIAATKLVRAQGLRARLTRRMFPQPIGDRTARQVWARQLRWSRGRRDGIPLIFLSEVFQSPVLPFAASLVLIATGELPLAFGLVMALLWYGSEMLLAWLAGWPHGWRDLAAMVVRDLLLPLIWLSTWAGRGFVWRGTNMTPVHAEKSAAQVAPD